MEAEIRLIDLFEAVMERPYFYTLGSSYAEAIAYLEGYQNGACCHKIASDDYFPDIKKYQEFKIWLADKFRLEEKAALKSLSEQPGDVFHISLKLYKEFKDAL